MTRTPGGNTIKRISTMSAALACVLATQAFAQDAATETKTDLPSPTALMDKHIEAVGGKEALGKFASRKMSGTLAVPSQRVEGDMVMLSAAPNKILITMNIVGMGENIQGYNGEVGWAINDFSGAMLLEDEMLSQAARDAEFNSELKYTDMYPTLETVEEVEFAGKTAYKVRQVAKDESESFSFFDKDSGLMIGNESITQSQMGEMPVTVVLSDYKEFDGIKVPTKTTINQMGTEVVLTIETVEHNKVDEAAFKTPAEIQALIDAKKAADDDDDDAVDDDDDGDGAG